MIMSGGADCHGIFCSLGSIQTKEAQVQSLKFVRNFMSKRSDVKEVVPDAFTSRKTASILRSSTACSIASDRSNHFREAAFIIMSEGTFAYSFKAYVHYFTMKAIPCNLQHSLQVLRQLISSLPLLIIQAIFYHLDTTTILTSTSNSTVYYTLSLQLTPKLTP